MEGVQLEGDQGAAVMRIRRSDLGPVVIVLSIVGYPLVAGAAIVVGLPSSFLSVLMRAVIVFLSIVVLIGANGRLERPSALAGVLFFFLLLFGMRLIEQTILQSKMLQWSAGYYWIWFVGVTVIPSLAIVFGPPINWAKFNYLAVWAFLVASVLAAISGSTSVYVDGILVETGRTGFASLNPISLGNVGVGLLLLAAWEFFGGGRSSFPKVFLFLLMFLGLYLIFISASRGPAISALVAIVFLWFSIKGRRKIWFLVGAFVVGMAAANVFFGGQLMDGISFAVRMNSLFSSSFFEDSSNSARLILYRSTIDQIIEHPFLGSSFENQLFKWNPHNIHLEFLMALGIPVGIMTFPAFLVVVSRARRIIRSGHAAGGISLLFVAYYVGSQFSGSVYSSSHLWLTALSVAIVSARLGRDVRHPTGPTRDVFPAVRGLPHVARRE